MKIYLRFAFFLPLASGFFFSEVFFASSEVFFTGFLLEVFFVFVEDFALLYDFGFFTIRLFTILKINILQEQFLTKLQQGRELAPRLRSNQVNKLQNERTLSVRITKSSSK